MQVFHYQFLHNILADYYRSVLDYMETLYPRFEHKVIGTYDKGIQYIVAQAENNRETDQPNLPAVILNPVGEVNYADANTGAIQLWRFPNLMSGFGKRLFEPIYQDSNIELGVIFSRLKGEFEVFILCNSYYEYIDLRMMFLQYFGGLERYIMPQYFNSFIILPDEIKTYDYENDVTGQSYTCDWSGTGLYDHLVKSTNTNEVVFPCKIKPIMKLTSISDGSDRYGGGDALPDWKLNLSIEYEIEIPTTLTLTTDNRLTSIDWEIRTGSAYSDGDDEVPITRWTYTSEWDEPMMDGTHNTVITDSTTGNIYELPEAPVDIVEKKHFILNDRFFHIVTKAEEEAGEDFEIMLPYTVDWHKQVLIVTPDTGIANRGVHYTLLKNEDNEYDRIVIKYGKNELNERKIKVFEGDIIEVYLYKEEAFESELGYGDPEFLSPEITNDPPTLVIDLGGSWYYAVISTLPYLQESKIEFSLMLSPSGMTINENSGLISWTPTGGQIGDHGVKIKALDSFTGLYDVKSFKLLVRT